jgi:para-nitrobenzyl esterase
MLVVAAAAALLVATAAGSAIVNTTYGPVVGLPHGNGTLAFLRIPFAAPPLGRLRWREPVPPTPWSQPLNATRQSSMCMQDPSVYNTTISEDCLYLNVFAPATAVNTASALAVMV